MKPGAVRLLALQNDDNRQTAVMVAGMLMRRSYETAGIFIDSLANSLGSRRLALELVADAIKNGDQFEPTYTRRRQIEAWDAAWCKHRGDNIAVMPTLPQVKHEFKRLFPKEKLPADVTFGRTFRELELLVRTERIGRPLGAKDKMKRKRRRPSWLKRFR
jgi:hypothetical protein